MVDSEDERPRKALRRHDCVMLTPQPQQSNEEQASLVVGQYLDGDIVSRSGLLAGLGHTNGPANLPDQLNPWDLQLWHTARLLPFDPSLEELVTILKVADVVGDDTADWVHDCAARVDEKLQARYNTDAAMLATLLQLPEHLLRAVLSKCMGNTELGGLLRGLPAPLHPAAMSADAAASGAICMPEEFDDGKERLQFLTTLAATVVPPPGLRSFTAGYSAFDSASAAVLANALSAHPSVTVLDLHNAAFQPAPLRTFAACLARGALPALRRLDIKPLGHSGGCAALADCLRCLPALTKLHVDITFEEDCTERTARHPTPNPYLLAASCPACLPNLKELTFLEDADGSNSRRSQASGDPSSVFMFLPLVKMPALSSLVFSSCSCKISLPVLSSALAKLRTLEDVHLSLHRIASPDEGSPCAVQPCRSDEQPQLRAALPLLRIISIAADSASHALAASSIVTPLATPSLTRLKLNGLSCEQLGNGNSDCRALAVLGRCTTLQELQFNIMLTPIPGARAARSSAALGDALQQLTALTSLTLQPVGAMEGHAGTCVLCAADIAAGLLPLTALGALHLSPSYNETYRPLRLLADHPQVLLDAVGQLPTLQSLSLCLHSMQQDSVVAVGLKLTALTQLVLLASLFEGGEGGEGGVSAFRARLPHSPRVLLRK